jgi:hypothetical protein
MKRAKRRKLSDKVYINNAKFKKYLEDRLQHEKNYREMLDAASGKLTEEVKKKEHDLVMERNRLQRMKDHWLDKCIFPSMANLTVFFESLGESEELRQVFEEDLRELLLGRKVIGIDKETNKKKYGPMVFQRFMRSLLTWNWKGDNTERTEKENLANINNFRLVLIHIIEYILFQHMTSIILYTSSNSAIVSKKITEDLTNVFEWSDLLARNVDTTLEVPSRPVKF